MVATKIKEMHEKIYAAAKMNQIKKAQQYCEKKKRDIKLLKRLKVEE